MKPKKQETLCHSRSGTIPSYSKVDISASILQPFTVTSPHKQNILERNGKQQSNKLAVRFVAILFQNGDLTDAENRTVRCGFVDKETRPRGQVDKTLYSHLT